MIYALSGVQGSGKTTTLNLLKQKSEFCDFVFYSEILRDLQARGFFINESGNNETQLAVVIMHLSNLLEGASKKVMVDRGLLDVYAYTLYHHQSGQISKSVYNLVKNVFESNIYKYDQIFLFEPHGGVLEDDGVRSTDLEWHDTINGYFHSIVKEYELDNVTILGEGTPASRVDSIVRSYNEWLYSSEA